MTERNRLPELAKLLGVGSFLLFFLSLISTAFFIRTGSQGAMPLLGAKVLLNGPSMLVRDFYANWPGLGNVALLAAWLALGTRANVIAGIFAAIAVATGASFFAMMAYGHINGLLYPGPGFWLWIASMLCALFAAILGTTSPASKIYST